MHLADPHAAGAPPDSRPDAADVLAALDARFAAMPPAAAMRIRAVAFDASGLHLHAPLAANVNDKGSAFGGSLASVLTLAAWGLVDARLRAQGRAAEVYVADSRIRYLLPLYEDLRAHAWVGPGEDWDAFVQCLDRRGQARVALEARIHDAAGTAMATLSARFVARFSWHHGAASQRQAGLRAGPGS